MYSSNESPARLIVALTILSRLSVGLCSSCAFGFAGFLDNQSYVPTWTVPRAEPYTTVDTVLNDGYTIASYQDEAAEITCSGDLSRFRVGYEKWSSNLTFPAAENEETENIPVGDLFYVNGTDLGVKSVPAASAVAFSDSLFGRTVQLNITCERADGSPFVITPEQGDSCIFFQVNTTNYSPSPGAGVSFYRFDDPALPAFELPPANTALNTSPGDIQLNWDNPIVSIDGSDVPWGCNGDIAEYLGEDGVWYSYFTGSDGGKYNFTHIFYATNTSQLNIATIQRVWSPNMEAALYNRTVRLMISCTNEVDYEEGYLLFRVGDPSFYDTCDTMPEVCTAVYTSGAGRNSAGGLWIGAVCTYLAMVVAASWYSGRSMLDGLF